MHFPSFPCPSAAGHFQRGTMELATTTTRGRGSQCRDLWLGSELSPGAGEGTRQHGEILRRRDGSGPTAGVDGQGGKGGGRRGREVDGPDEEACVSSANPISAVYNDGRQRTEGQGAEVGPWRPWSGTGTWSQRPGSRGSSDDRRPGVLRWSRRSRKTRLGGTTGVLTSHRRLDPSGRSTGPGGPLWGP